ncbi:reverse transcriptase domain-containing protein [Tanacetum coccineum]
MSKYRHFHEDYGHEINDCCQLRSQIEEAVKLGQLSHLVKEIKKERAKASENQRVEGKKDKGTTPTEAPILMIRQGESYTRDNTSEDFITEGREITFPSVTRGSNSSAPVIIKAKTFGREVGRVHMDSGSSCEFIYEHCFMKLKPSIRASKIDSKIPLIGFSGEKSCSNGEIPLEITIGDPPLARRETLNCHCKGLGPDRNTAACKEVEELTKEGILREVKHQTWVANPIMVKKSDKGWRMRVDFTDINKACPKDCYPLSEIDWKALTKLEESGQVAKSEIKLGEHDIVFQKRGDDKKETPKDFLIEVPLEDNRKEAEGRTDIKSEKMKLSCKGKLYTDGAASFDGSGAGLMLIDPEGKEYTYALHFGFETTNNKAQYEALLVGLRIAQDMEIISLVIFVDSHSLVNKIKGTYAAKQPTIREYLQKTREVLVEVLSKRSIEGKEILQVETKEEESWMTLIHEYLTENIVKEIHEGSCGFNVEPSLRVVRITKKGYYWPSMHRDAAKVIQDCEKCKEQSAIRKAAENSAITVGNGWPFSHYGVNILGPLPTAPGGLKFLAIAVENSTKWVEANPLTTIKEHTERSLQRIESHTILFPNHRAYGNNEPYRKAIDSKSTRMAENTVTKYDREITNEVTKRKESKEVASIEEAYYQNKLHRKPSGMAGSSHDK